MHYEFIFVFIQCFIGVISKCCQKGGFRENIKRGDGYRRWVQTFAHYVRLDRYGGSCNAVDDTSIRICVLNKTEDVNLNVFNMITRINESNTLPKHISRNCRCEFDSFK